MGQERGFDVIAFGEPLIGFYPVPEGGDEYGPLYRMTWGGDTSNFSIAVTKLGHRCSYLTRVGSDRFGDGMVDLWARHGVAVDMVQRDPKRKVGLYFVSFEGRQHEFTYYRKGSAASAIDPELVDWDAVASARLLHVSGISQAVSEAALDLSFQLMAFARERGIIVSYDVNYRPSLWSRDRAKAAIAHTVAEYADVLEITDEEMELLGWGREPEQIADRLPRMPRCCAVKLGARGSWIAMDGRSIRTEPFPVTVEDTVGAGDAFDAGLAAALLEGKTLEEAARLANATAALTCRGSGPLRTQPDRTEAERFLDSQRL